MMVQSFEGSTTIVPQVSFVDYFRLFSDPKLDHLYHYFQAGSGTCGKARNDDFGLLIFVVRFCDAQTHLLNFSFMPFPHLPVAAYEHTAMIKLHYSLVDVLEDCIEKLERDSSGKKRKNSKPRTRIVLPESKSRATIVLAESEKYAVDVLSHSPANREIAENTQEDRMSSTSDSFAFDYEDDEDSYERSWVESPY